MGDSALPVTRSTFANAMCKPPHPPKKAGTLSDIAKSRRLYQMTLVRILTLFLRREGNWQAFLALAEGLGEGCMLQSWDLKPETLISDRAGCWGWRRGRHLRCLERPQNLQRGERNEGRVQARIRNHRSGKQSEPGTARVFRLRAVCHCHLAP